MMVLYKTTKKGVLPCTTNHMVYEYLGNNTVIKMSGNKKEAMAQNGERDINNLDMWEKKEILEEPVFVVEGIFIGRAAQDIREYIAMHIEELVVSRVEMIEEEYEQ